MVEMKPLPESYVASKDTLNIAATKWDLFYKDQKLKQLIEISLANNYDLQAAMQKIEIARSSLRLNKGAQLPSLSAGIGAAQRKFGLYTMDGAGNATTDIRPGQIVPEHLPDYLAGFNASWEVDVWGKLRSKKKAAAARYSGSIEGKNAIQTALIAEVASAYFELLALDNELDIIRETIVLQQAALEVIKIKKAAAVLNELAVKQFEGQLSNSKAFEFEIIQKIALTENRLNFLSGQFPQTILRDKTKFNAENTSPISLGIPSQLLKNRPDIRQAELELIASKCDVKSAKAAFYPSFTITGSVGYQAFKTALLFQSPDSFAYTILGGLTAPLLNRSAIKAQFNTAKANQTEALLNYQKTILNGYIEVANELSNLNNLKQLYELKDKEVASYTQSITIANDLFKSGRASYLEVLMSQRTALESKIELITTKKLQHQAAINLYKALGGGWQ
ncbi:NodT family efflux transporter outer membrane factor (OMF) lipoprotein [Flavobacterium granuli]|uniref:Efflux transporter, outer membrane factor (OMF) lipoprotein, NodT family n=2 Tax=Flavobacterium granuli TaxID=280093 RepID=A0A1M5IE26_9FLAO|nr:NodT family efflux transporter outer membrane factor (OMF) lipoprotein [Flavobacterium granuli]SHG26497.1 efflux transporter, outer membrane factor (OMF) lipoprotein, NodT family [Flavobacterium granuli]